MRLAIAFVLAGCSTELPVPETAISPEARAAAFPQLAPIGDILAQASAQSPAIPAGDALATRAARLKARADLLRGLSVEDGQAALKRAR